MVCLFPNRLSSFTEAVCPLLLSMMAGKISLTHICCPWPLSALPDAWEVARHHSCLPAPYSLFVNIQLKLKSCFIKVTVDFLTLYLMMTLPSTEHFITTGTISTVWLWPQNSKWNFTKGFP